MLFYPFEEEFDLPSVFVESGDIERSKVEIVRQEDESSVLICIEELYSPQVVRIADGRLRIGQSNCLVAAKAALFVDGRRIQTLEGEVVHRTCDKERFCLFDAVEPFEVFVPSVHDVEAIRLEIN